MWVMLYVAFAGTVEFGMSSVQQSMAGGKFLRNYAISTAGTRVALGDLIPPPQ
jgi:hypothetical protein